jgi:hypothetical protein
MCEDGGCTKPEEVEPELLEEMYATAERKARSRGQTVDEMLASFGPRDRIGQRFRKLKL